MPMTKSQQHDTTMRSAAGKVWRLRGLFFAALSLGILPIGTTHAQTCGTDYAIKDGETLAQIAGRTYGSPAQWTIIFYANQDRLGANGSLLTPGLAIRLPCIGSASQPQPAPPAIAAPAQALSANEAFIISSLVRRLEVLTADNYQPYTGRALEGGGMLTQVLSASLDLIKEESKGKFDYGVSWVNDWAAHLNPLLLTRAFDVGFPWARPECEVAATLDAGSQLRCQKFFFADPMYEVVTSMFVRSNGSRITSLRNEEILGTSLCRPTGYPVHELDRAGRNWVKDSKITLIRPSSVDECFRLLDSGSVDGVVMSELVGRASIASLGFTDRVRVIDQPVALTTLHVLISKTHPHARTILYYLNSSLAKLRESGEYDRIVERHLARFWESQTNTPNPALAATPASQPKPAAPKAAPAAPASGNPAIPPALAQPARAPSPPPTSTAKSEPAR
jgi:polar amino acid transport system substrate-binding protein